MMNNLFFFTIKVASVGLFFSCTSFELIGKKRGMLPNTCASHGSNIDINPIALEAEKTNNVVICSTEPLYGGPDMLASNNPTKQELEIIIKNMPYYVNITKEEVAKLMCKLIALDYIDLIKLLLEMKDDIDLHASSSDMHTFGGPVNIFGVAIDNGELEIFKMLVNKDPSLLNSIVVGYYSVSGDGKCTAVERIMLNKRDEMLHWVLSEEKLRNSIPYAHLEAALKSSVSIFHPLFSPKLVKILVEEGEMPLPGNVLEMVRGYIYGGYIYEGADTMFAYLGRAILDNRRQCSAIKPLLDKIVNTDITILITSYLLFPNVKIPKRVCSLLEGIKVKASASEEYVEEEYVEYEDLQAALDKYENLTALRTRNLLKRSSERM